VLNSIAHRQFDTLSLWNVGKIECEIPHNELIILNRQKIVEHFAPPMTILDGCDEVGIGFDLGWQIMSCDFDQVVAGQQIGGIAVGQALLGQDISAIMTNAM
jgi:hypothetical protein